MTMQWLGLCGSLRAASYNQAILGACPALLPAGVSLATASLAGIPMYDQDLFDRGVPEQVVRLADAIRAADGVLIATPEYNFSTPAVLKNAIDWISRLPAQPWRDKPVAIVSASTGPLGGARVQYDLRRILGQLWAMVLPRPEVFIGNVASKFDADGRLVDETTQRFLSEQLAGFAQWVPRCRCEPAERRR